MIGEDRVIDVAGLAARIKLYETLRENGININPLNGEVIYDEITRQTIQEFSKMRKMIEFITGEGIAVDDEQARILARQQMQHGGEGDPTPSWMGKEVNVSLKGCDPLREQIQKWKNKTITVTMGGEEVILNLSKVEQLEHVIDGLFLTGNADKAREMWAEQLGGERCVG
jgi:hypothetical protein